MTKLEQAEDVVRTESTLRDLKAALGPAGIAFLVLKGVHLGAVHYPRPEDRPHQDVDILVRPAEFDRACNEMLAHAFVRSEADNERPETAQAFYCHHFRSRAGLLVELHRDWAGYGRYPLDVEGVFARAEPFSFGKTEVLGLSPEDLLLNLCVHMAKGYFADIARKHVEDVDAVLARRPMDWPLFLARARAARCRVGAYYALLTARETCGARVPSEVIESLRPAAWRRWLIGGRLDPRQFPPCRIPLDRVGRIQAFLALPLLDRPRDWPAVLQQFLRVRTRDAFAAGRPIGFSASPSPGPPPPSRCGPSGT